MASTKDRDDLVLANLGLCYYVAKRMCTINPIVRRMGYDEAVSCCQAHMLRIAECYDPAIGKFSTYCVTSLQRQLIREAGYWNKAECRTLVTEPEASDCGSGLDTELVPILLSHVTGRDLDIVHRHFGLGGYEVAQERREIAAFYSISPERVSQVLRRAMKVMQTAAARRSKAKDALSL